MNPDDIQPTYYLQESGTLQPYIHYLTWDRPINTHTV